MAEILLCPKPVSHDHIKIHFGVPAEHLIGMDLKTPSIVKPHHPYLISEHPAPIDHSILKTLGSVHDLRGLTEVAQICGACHLSSFGKIQQDLKDAKIHEREPGEEGEDDFGEKVRTGVHIAAHTVHTGIDQYLHSKGIAEATKNYKQKLLEYNKALKSKDFHLSNLARQKAKTAYKEMQKVYQASMKLMRDHKAIESSIKKGVHSVVDKSKSILDVNNLMEAHNLGKMAKGLKFVGNGIVAFNLYEGVKKVETTYKRGGDWEREMTKQSLTIAADAAVGDVAVAAGLELGAIVLAVTPIGWVGLLLAGVAIGATAVAGVAGAGVAKKGVEEITDSIFDKVEHWVSNL